MYDYGARFYNPQIARFHSVGPILYEANVSQLFRIHNGKHFSNSPYSYTFCNPIIFNDPDGRSPNLPNRAETRLMLQSGRNLVAATRIKRNSAIALDAARGFAREQTSGNRSEMVQSLNEGEGKAFRHAFFSAMNGRDVGVSLARQFGEAYEAFDNNPFEAMGLSNNEVGFLLIKEDPSKHRKY